MNTLYDLVIVMPIYNEEECIVDVLRSWMALLSDMDIDYLIIALNDGSTDGTEQALSVFSNEDRVDVVNNANSGHGPTILRGYKTAVAQAKWVFQCDSDDEMKPALFPALWQKRKDYDILFGCRTGREQNIGRWFISFCSRVTVRLFFGQGVRDVNTPYRLMRSDLLSQILEIIPENTFAPNVIISGSFAKSGARIYNMSVPYEFRQTGTVSIVRWKLWKSAFRALWQTPVAKEKFSQTYNFPSNQIKIMPNAVSRFIKVPQETSAKPEIFKNNTSFNLFFLTSYYLHKNLEILIEIFKKHREKLYGVRCIITISGEQYHKKAQNFLNDIEKNDLQEYIVNVGPLEQEELAGYFHNSDALFFPTLLESFSATYLEAMHFGLPIVTSDLDFARYICDDTAVYFDPWKPEDAVDKILLIKNNPQLRQELIEKGKKRISTFYKSWEEIVSDAMSELEQLVRI